MKNAVVIKNHRNIYYARHRDGESIYLHANMIDLRGNSISIAIPGMISDAICNRNKSLLQALREIRKLSIYSERRRDYSFMLIVFYAR